MDTQSILIVDDEAPIREVVRNYLEHEGFTVYEAGAGKQALDVMSDVKLNLVILDIMLPEIDGFRIADTLRNASEYGSLYKNTNVPIIMLTSRSDEDDRLNGFEVGTDDYVLKPFSPRELVMRVKAVLKRATSSTEQTSGLTENYNGLEIDPNARSLRLHDQFIELTAKEFDLLWFLAQNANQVFSREQLLDQVWGRDFYGDDSTVTVHVSRLRDKIEAVDPEFDNPLQTVWGVGYKFIVT